MFCRLSRLDINHCTGSPIKAGVHLNGIFAPLKVGVNVNLNEI